MIRVLEREVSELIAAGEVVERPASVVKELVENAVDAGAAAIEIEIRGGGLELIRVTDNGCGIPVEEMPTAFLRHATSKIRGAEDLDGIATLGFRGEALAAIGAVSRTRMVSKTPSADYAAQFRIEAGEPLGVSECGAPDGTSVYVSELFYNTPARMKFLKKDIYEGNAVAALVEQLALSRPDIAFRLVRDGKTLLSTPGDGKLYSAIFSVFPQEIASGMIPVSPAPDGVRVTGFISGPGLGRPGRTMQYTYVNGRFVKSRGIAAAAEEACRGLLMQGKHPCFVLCVDMPEQHVDVNVHPAKTEVRFKNEREVTSAVYAAVKVTMTEAAGGFSIFEKPAAEAVEGGEEVRRVDEKAQAAQDLSEISTAAEPPEAQNGMDHSAARDFAGYVPQDDNCRQQLPLMLEQTVLSDVRRNTGMIDIAVEPERLEAWRGKTLPPESDKAPPPSLRYVGEVFDTYILAQAGEQLILIDKHAAHERLLYEKLNAGQLGDRQTLLLPVVVPVSAREKQALADGAPQLAEIGFVAEDFGRGEVAVREIPTHFPPDGVADAVVALADKLLSGANDLTPKETVWLLHSTACRAAIKAGHKSDPQELLALAEEILNGSMPKFCPHGRPVYVLMDKKELEKRFGRA